MNRPVGNFTPGPWAIEKCACGHPSCNRYGTDNGVFYQGSGYSIEDAHLIASSPCLYGALEAAVLLLERTYIHGPSPAEIAAGRVALAKARGQ